MDCEAVETVFANRCPALGVPVYEIFANLACNKIGISEGRSPEHGPCGGGTTLGVFQRFGAGRRGNLSPATTVLHILGIEGTFR
jgi:hypothetical protein